MDYKKKLEDTAKFRREQAKQRSYVTKNQGGNKYEFAASYNVNRETANPNTPTLNGEFLTGPLSAGESRTLMRAKREALKKKLK